MRHVIGTKNVIYAIYDLTRRKFLQDFNCFIIDDKHSIAALSGPAASHHAEKDIYGIYARRNDKYHSFFNMLSIDDLTLT
jgi:hypothetical protein